MAYEQRGSGLIEPSLHVDSLDLTDVLLLADEDAPYVAHVAERIARMFERYSKNIDPESESFRTFVTAYLSEKNVKDARAIPYVELYNHIKNAIGLYLRQIESNKGSNQSTRKPT